MKAKEKETIYWASLHFREWKLYIAATSNGLCFVGSQNMPFNEVASWTKKRFPEGILMEDELMLKPYIAELVEYLEGKRTTFTITMDRRGTPFQLAVWDALCEIPYGQTSIYSEIANSINKPTAVRAVGAAIGANPVLITIPCHRVIGKNGTLTGFRGGLEMKARLLKLEQQG